LDIRSRCLLARSELEVDWHRGALSVSQKAERDHKQAGCWSMFFKRVLRSTAICTLLASCTLSFVTESGISTAQARKSHSRLSTSLATARKPIGRSVSWPLQIAGSQYTPINWADMTGWTDDDHLSAYQTFRASCA